MKIQPMKSNSTPLRYKIGRNIPKENLKPIKNDCGVFKYGNTKWL